MHAPTTNLYLCFALLCFALLYFAFAYFAFAFTFAFV
jgi:hypothetical protein